MRRYAVGSPPKSSLPAIGASVASEEPRKTPSTSSNVLLPVSKETVPSAGAVQRCQADAPPALPAIGGSPASTLASTFDCVTDPLVPLSVSALAYRSFAGAVAGRQLSVYSPWNSSFESAFPTTMIVYVRPATTGANTL